MRRRGHRLPFLGQTALGAAALASALPAAEPTAAERALAYLAREVPAWREQHACGSCHNNGDGARALFRAVALGRPVPEEALTSTLRWLGDPSRWTEADEPERSDAKLARLQFGAALAAAGAAGLVEEGRVLVETAAALAREQDADGAWRIAEQSSMGSPVAWGPAVATWMGRRILLAADPARFAPELARAERWLVETRTRSVMDAAAALLGLEKSDAQGAAARRGSSLELLERAQTSDGGWGPWPGSAPEAFDTALALLALARVGSGSPEQRERLSRGREYLARTQLAHGGWIETTRPAGYQSYAQHVSTTAWVVLALLESAERESASGLRPPGSAASGRRP